MRVISGSGRRWTNDLHSVLAADREERLDRWRWEELPVLLIEGLAARSE
jgi:hypothetical protein